MPTSPSVLSQQGPANPQGPGRSFLLPQGEGRQVRATTAGHPRRDQRPPDRPPTTVIYVCCSLSHPWTDRSVKTAFIVIHDLSKPTQIQSLDLLELTDSLEQLDLLRSGSHSAELSVESLDSKTEIVMGFNWNDDLNKVRPRTSVERTSEKRELR